MVTEAISKIKEEMKNGNSPYITVIGEFLLKHLEFNPIDASKILNKDKSISKSVDAMKDVASKRKVGNYAVLTDSEGFEIVLRYFEIDSKITNKQIKDIEQPKEKLIQHTEDIFDVKLEDFLN